MGKMHPWEYPCGGHTHGKEYVHGEMAMGMGRTQTWRGHAEMTMGKRWPWAEDGHGEDMSMGMAMGRTHPWGGDGHKQKVPIGNSYPWAGSSPCPHLAVPLLSHRP